MRRKATIHRRAQRRKLPCPCPVTGITDQSWYSISFEKGRIGRSYSRPSILQRPTLSPSDDRFFVFPRNRKPDIPTIDSVFRAPDVGHEHVSFFAIGAGQSKNEGTLRTERGCHRFGRPTDRITKRCPRSVDGVRDERSCFIRKPTGKPRRDHVVSTASTKYGGRLVSALGQHPPISTIVLPVIRRQTCGMQRVVLLRRIDVPRVVAVIDEQGEIPSHLPDRQIS
jgi:hypothetical protein